MYFSGNVHNDLNTRKPATENEKLTKTHLSVSKRDLHIDNKPKIKIDKPEDKHKTEKRSHRKGDKVKISDKTEVIEREEKKKKDKSHHQSKEEKSQVESKDSSKIEKSEEATKKCEKISPVLIQITEIGQNYENEHTNKNGKLPEEGTSLMTDKDKDIDETELLVEDSKSVECASKVNVEKKDKIVSIKPETREKMEKFKHKPKLDKKKYTPSIDEKLENLNESLGKMTETREKLDKLKNKHAKELKPIKQSSSSMEDSKPEYSNDNSDEYIEIKEKSTKIKHKRTKDKTHDQPQISTSLEEDKTEISNENKKIKHKRTKEKPLEKLELSSSLEEDQIHKSNESLYTKSDTKEKLEKAKHKRPKDTTQDKMKQSSSLDRIKHKDGEKHKYDTRSKREKYAKRHSDDRLLNKNIEIDKDISKHSEKESLGNKKRFTKAKPPNVLVFADCHETKENVKGVLKQVLNENK